MSEQGEGEKGSGRAEGRTSGGGKGGKEESGGLRGRGEGREWEGEWRRGVGMEEKTGARHQRGPRRLKNIIMN